VLSGGCYEYEATSPYLPFVEALREWVRRQSDEGLRLYLDMQAAEIAKLAPEIENRLGPLPANPSLEASDERLRLFDNIARFFQRLAEKSGLLLFIDDIHWADQGTLSLLHYLLRNLRQERFMVLACYREVELDRQHPFADSLVEWNRERLAIRTSLNRLDYAEVGQLLASLFTQESTSDEFTQAIYCETEGNPFFVEEVIKSLIEQRQIYWENGKWQRQEITDLVIPQSIKEAVGRRLSRQGEACIEMLHTAAALGKRFSYAELAVVARQGENELLDILDEASNAQLLRLESGDSFAFTHDKIREVLYEELNPIRRRRLHLRIGEGLEQLYGLAEESKVKPISGGDGRVRSSVVESLAHHFIEGGDLVKGMRYAIRAAELARQVFALDEALNEYQHALECAEALEDIDQQAKLYEALGSVQDQRGMVQASTESFERALQMVESQQERARLKTMLGSVYAQIGDDRGRTHLLEALDELDPQTQPRELARVNALLGRYHHLHAEWDTAIQYLERARLLAEPLDKPSELVDIYAYLAGAYQWKGDYETSMEWAHRNITLGETYGILVSEALGHEFLAEDYFATGRWHESLEHAEIDFQIGERIGSLQRQAWGIFSRAAAYHGLGQLEKALQTANECLQIVDRTGEHRLEALIRTNRASIYGDLDDFSAAWDDADYVVQRAEISGQGQLRIWGVDVRVNLYTLQERWQELVDLVTQVKSEMGDRYAGQNILALIHLDRHQDLLRMLEGLDRSELDQKEANSPWYWYIIALADAYLGNSGEAAASIDKAIELFEKREERISLGRLLCQRAIFRQQAGSLALARQDAQRALDLFALSGAKFHQSTAEKILQQLPA
jgi:tetratricopeptide (TPR) repeat protein